MKGTESFEAECLNTPPTLPTLSPFSLMHSKSIAFKLFPSSFAFFPPAPSPLSVLLAVAQADLWYSPSMLISGSDYTNGFCYGGRGGGWEGNPTAPGLGFFKGIKLLIPPESCREGVHGILFKSLPTPYSSLPHLEWVLPAVPCIAVSFKGGGRQGNTGCMAANTRVCVAIIFWLSLWGAQCYLGEHRAAGELHFGVEM